MSTFVQRLQLFMESRKINDNQMTIAAGLSNGLLGKTKASGKGMSSLNIEKILLAYPELNSEWLLTGKGEMLKSNITLTADSSNDFVDDKEQHFHDITFKTRPRIPFDAAAGSLSIAFGSVTEYECERMPVIPSFPKYDFTIITRGDSMIPEFQSGDELACAFVKESSFIQWGRPHVLDTTQGVVLKKIFNNQNSIICRSINSDYPDFEVPKNEIYHIAIVVGLLRHF